MAILYVNIKGKTDGADGIDQTITNLKARLKAVETEPIKIKVEAIGIDEVNAKVTKYLNALARLTSAQAKMKEADNAVRIEQERTAQQYERTRQEFLKYETALQKVNQEVQKTATQQEKTRTQYERTRQSAVDYMTQQEKTATQVAKTNTQIEKNKVALQESAKATEETTSATANLSSAFQILAARLLYVGWAEFTKAMREALDTMREVDQELTNIQKVSNASTEEIKKLGDAAYDTASKYGVAAEDYLSAVYTFQKAGIGDSATQLGELATKTMLVGDTTEKVASRFILATNAAWELSGSYEALSRVVDEADYINNNYATDLFKLSEGMPIVAASAANMNMSIEQTLAVLGTITARTQETGRKAATAWRALIMNITGQLGSITDETGEVIEVTEQTVKTLTDALKIYGNEAVRAAIETGRVINPMEAVISLASAYKDGLINDIELTDLLMETGGKLRANQLTALVKDIASETSIYKDILEKLPQAAGTADTEITTMLGSWNAKTEILQNTWTEFVSNMIETDAIKGGLDTLTGIIETLDTDFGRAAVSGLALATLLQGVPALITAIGKAIAANGVLSAIFNPTTLVFAAAIAGIIGVVNAIDKLNVSYKEQKQIVADLNAEYDQMFGKGSEYDTLKSKTDELTEREKKRLEVLEAQRIAAEATLAAAKELEFKKWNEENWAGEDDNWIAPTPIYELRTALEEVIQKYNDAEISQDQFKGSLLEFIDTNKEYYNSLIEYKEYGFELLDGQKQFIQVYEAISTSLSMLNYEQSSVADGAGKANVALKTQAELYNTLKANLTPLNTAIKELNEKGGMTDSTMQALIEKYPDLKEGITLTEKGWSISKETLDEYVKSLDDTYEAEAANYQLILDNAMTAAQEIVDAEALKKAGIDATTLSVKEQLLAMAKLYDAQEGAYIQEHLGAQNSSTSYIDALLYARQYTPYHNMAQQYWSALEDLVAKEKDLGNATENLDRVRQILNTGWDTGDNRSNGSNRSDKTTSGETDALLLQYEKDLANEKALYELLKARGESADVLDKQIKVIQDKLNQRAERRRALGRNEAENYADSKEWWDWQGKLSTPDDPLKALQALQKETEAYLSFLKESGAGEAERVKVMREEQDLLHQQADELRRQNPDWETNAEIHAQILSLSQKWWSVQNDINDLLQEGIKSVEDLKKEYADALATTLKDMVDTAQELATGPLQEQIDALQKQADLEKAQREEAEKLLAVEKARDDLEKARNERNIRIYNAKTGQWEWVANAKNIQTAEEALRNANEALLEYRQRSEIDALKENLTTVKAAYSSLSDAIETVAKKIKDGSMSFQDAYDYIKASMKNIYDTYGIDLTSVLGTSANALGKVEKKIEELYRDVVIAKMKANSESWWNYYQNGDKAGMSAKAAENEALGSLLNLHKDGNGVWRDKDGNVVFYPANAQKSSSGSKTVVATVTRSTDYDEPIGPPSSSAGLSSATTPSLPGYYKVYDSGGILTGLGGIKATRQDEMVLPPTMTKSLLTAQKTGAFDALLKSLGIVTAAGQRMAVLAGGESKTAIGEQHNGDVYTIGGVTITEDRAKSMTVYDLAQHARGLALQRKLN